MPAFLTDRQWLAVLLAVFMAVALSACGGGGGGGTAPMPDPEPMPPTAEEMCTDAGNHWVDGACMTPGEYTVHMTLASIAAAATAADAQAAYDAVKDQVTATQGEALQDAVDARVAALAAMDRAADQKAALMAAAGMIDTSDLSTQEAVDAARAANVALRAALDAADDVSDADKAMYQAQLNAAVAAVDDAQDGIDTDTRRMNQMEALADASTALASALTALSGATPTQEQLDAANAALGDLNAAVTGGADLTDEEKAPYALQASNASAPIATAQAAYDAAEEKRLAGEARARQLVLNAASMQVAKAINAHRVAGDPPAEFVPNTAAATDPANGLTISRGSGAAKITPLQSAADKKRKPFATGTAQDAGTGWSGMTFTRSGTEAKKAFTEMAAVYTDIEAAKDALWATAFDGTTGTGLGLTEADGPVTMVTTARVNASHFTGGILPVGPTGNDDTSTVELGAGEGRIGTFYGVSGRFSCAAACVVSRDDKGIVSVSADMIFTPNAFDALTTMAKYASADTDYTLFGYWMKSTKQRDGSYNHDIETFHGGTGAAIAAVTTDVTGTAKYYGAAAGVYVKKDGAGDSLVVSDGNFTADAMLTARFGGDKIAVDDQHMISGTISGFMDGSTNLGFADLTLEDADFNPGGTPTNLFTGETNGGGTSGNWRGSFYGNSGAGTTAALPNGDPAASDDFPQNVSGEFNGHFVNGHVAGAFGAEKD